MRIFARSPYIIEVNESGQTGSKVEVYIWNSGSVPASPQYTLSKNVPTSTNSQTTYNVSPYVLEYFNLDAWSGVYNTYDVDVNTDHYANVQIKRYKDVSGTFTLLDTIDYTAFSGFGLFSDGANPDLGRVMLDQGDYTYKEAVGVVGLDSNKAGTITIDTSLNDIIRYTNLKDSTVIDYNITSTGVREFPRVHADNLADGNKVELIYNFVVVYRTYYFRPQCENKYTPVIIDYVNRYGAWARTFFYKASKRSFKTSSKDFSSLHSSNTNYSLTEAKNSSFNFSGIESVSLNSGWVKEEYSEELKQLMLSERILLDGEPVKCDSKSLDIQKHLDTKQINYSLNFSYANDYMNNIV